MDRVAVTTGHAQTCELTPAADLRIQRNVSCMHVLRSGVTVTAAAVVVVTVVATADGAEVHLYNCL